MNNALFSENHIATHSNDHWAQTAVPLLLLGLGVVLVLVFGWLSLVFILGLFAFTGRTRGLPAQLNQARPLSYDEAPFLFDMTTALLRAGGIGRGAILYLHPSPVANAAAVGAEGNPTIVVTRGLLARLNRRELAGVLAHEVAHLVHKDLTWIKAINIGSVVATTLGEFALFFGFFGLLFGSFSLGHLLLIIAMPFLAWALRSSSAAFLRHREFEADATAAALTGDPMGLASALYSLEAPRSFGFASIFERIFGYRPQRYGYESSETDPNATHPDTRARIRRLRAMA